MDRIENGGTAGGDALRRLVERCWSLRGAARRGRGRTGRRSGWLSFVDGWAVGKTEKTRVIDEDARPTLEDERVMTVKPSQVTIGEKSAKIVPNRLRRVVKALSFDVDE